MTAEDIAIKREITVYEQKIAALKSRIKRLKKKLEEGRGREMIESIIDCFMNGEFKKMRVYARKFGLKRTYVEIYQNKKLSTEERLDMIYMIATRNK